MPRRKNKKNNNRNVAKVSKPNPDEDLAWHISASNTANKTLFHRIIIQTFFVKQTDDLKPHESTSDDLITPQTTDVLYSSLSDIKNQIHEGNVESNFFAPTDVPGDGNCFFRSLLIGNKNIASTSAYHTTIANKISLLSPFKKRMIIQKNHPNNAPSHADFDYLRKAVVMEASIRYYG